MYKSSLSGYFLFLAVSALLLYEASFLFPLVLLALIGTLFSVYQKKKGFALALLLLTGYSIVEYPRLTAQPWLFYFLASLVMSWVIALMQSTQEEEKKEELVIPTAEHFFPQPVESIPREISLRYEQVEQQLLEKAEALKTARRDLFTTETALFTVQRQRQEESLQPLEVWEEISYLETRCIALEEEITVLEQVIGVLLSSPQKRTRARRKASPESLDLLTRLNQMEEVAQESQSHLDQNQ